MADIQMLAQYFKLADAAHACEETQEECEHNLWQHWQNCSNCKTVTGWIPEARLNCDIGTSLQHDYAKSTKRFKKANAELSQVQFSVRKEMSWPDIFAYAVGVFTGDWVAIEIERGARRLSDQARDLITETDRGAVPVPVACSIVNNHDDSYVLIILTSEIRAAYERTKPKISTVRQHPTDIPSTQVNWELLPADTGNSSQAKEALITRLAGRDSGDAHIRKVILERIEFFDNLGDPPPQGRFVGLNSFSSYFGVKFSNDVVALEHPLEGNAIYIVFGEWEKVSKQSRSELLAIKNEDRTFVRVFHVGDWRERFKEKLRDIQSSKQDTSSKII
jgi:hypothetical protein